MSETAMAVVQLETEDHQPENGFVPPESTSPGSLTRIDGCVLPFLGGFGKYQRHLIVLTWIPAIFIGFSQYSDNFLLAQPNNTCVQPLTNTTNLSRTHSSLYNGPGNSTTRPAYIYANGSYGTRNDSANMQCMCKEWTFELHTGLVRNVVTKWSLVCESAWKVHIAKFSLLVGSIFGYLVFGVLADWFGRHPVLIISVFFMLVFGLTVAFSINVPMFSTVRFFEGFCLAGITLSLYVLRIELCLPGWRFTVTMVASFVVLGGQLLMPGVAYLCRDWQVLQAVIVCPLFLMLSYIWIFPESLRWLLSTQQYSRSKYIMGHIAKKNQINTELDPDLILTELQRALQMKPKRTCIVKMVGTRNLWKNIVVLCVNSLTGYGIHHCFARSMMDHEAHDTAIFHNFYADYYTKAGIAVASCLALCPAVGLMGRRGGLLMFMIITALASLLQLGLLNLVGKYSVQLNIERSDTLNKNFSIAFSIIGMFSSHAVSNLSIFFCAEITPTVIRGGGLGLVLASAGFGILTAPIMELHNQKGYFLHHIIFACCTLICIICILLLPETRYQPLPETLADSEFYTRPPLLPPRKPVEQRLLLAPQDGSRDDTHDTPLHEAGAAGAAASTMDSTASSAVDLTAPSVVDVSASPATELGLLKPRLAGRNGRSFAPPPGTPSALDEGGVVLGSREKLLSSTPLHKAPPSPTEPLLASAEDSTTPLMKSVAPSIDSPATLVNDSGPFPAKDSPPSTPAIVPLSISSLDSPVTDPPSTPILVSTTSSFDPPPTSTSPSPVLHDLIPSPAKDSSINPLLELDPTSTLDSTTSPFLEVLPPPTLDYPTSPVLETTPPPILDCTTSHVLETTPPPILDCTTSHVLETTPPPILDCTTSHVLETTPPPILDCTTSHVLETTPPPILDSSTQPVIDPRPPSPSRSPTPQVNDTDPPPTHITISVESPPPVTLDSINPTSPDPVSPSVRGTASTPDIPSTPPTADCTILPVTDLVLPTTPLVIDSEPVAATDCPPLEAPPPAFLVDCTVSSPVDFGLLPVTDCAITGNSIVNGVDSS
ncbi:solute carrier family 22 member 23 [Hypomesus transpacificus]|uniref:solute carrier family 22 member 23 n=1 Tax=Hypomesus transpacificus TaxID=137520 RepID=UPI001F07CAE8|nr:solute carrier family 22 member 23 [Hypomesus transpacificus]